jgi:hypothetical protein
VEDWRKLLNEELRNRYCFPNIIRMITSKRMRGAGEVARIREKINAYRALVRKPEGKKSRRRFRRGDGRILNLQKLDGL